MAKGPKQPRTKRGILDLIITLALDKSNLLGKEVKARLVKEFGPGDIPGLRTIQQYMKNAREEARETNQEQPWCLGAMARGDTGIPCEAVGFLLEAAFHLERRWREIREVEIAIAKLRDATAELERQLATKAEGSEKAEREKELARAQREQSQLEKQLTELEQRWPWHWTVGVEKGFWKELGQSIVDGIVSEMGKSESMSEELRVRRASDVTLMTNRQAKWLWQMHLILPTFTLPEWLPELCEQAGQYANWERGCDYLGWEFESSELDEPLKILLWDIKLHGTSAKEKEDIEHNLEGGRNHERTHTETGRVLADHCL